MPPPKTYTPAAFASSITACASRPTASNSPSGTTIAALGKEIRYLAIVRFPYRWILGLDANQAILLPRQLSRSSLSTNCPESSMRKTLVLIGLCLVLGQAILVLGPSILSTAQKKKIAATVSIPSDAIDQRCEIALNRGTPGSTVIDAGTIVRFDEESVVLMDVTRTVRVEQSVPI